MENLRKRGMINPVSTVDMCVFRGHNNVEGQMAPIQLMFFDTTDPGGRVGETSIKSINNRASKSSAG